MAISKSTIISGLIVAAVISLASVVFVRAQDTSITGQQIEKVRSNCVSTKNTLNQLHASDALLRVNRGQVYESIQTKLMDRFNSRVASSKINNDDLISITVEYGKALNKFRQDYKLYEEGLSVAIGIDCLAEPAAFYDAIALTRLKRSYVHDDVKNLNYYIDQYQLALNKLEKDYVTAAKGISQ